MRFLPKFVLLLLVLASLAGCSGARLAYNNADTLVRWTADDYFALEGPQEEGFKARLARFHAWHRSEELPRYSALMTSAGDRLTDGLTARELVWVWDSVKARYRHMVAHAAPELAAVLATLRPAQFDRLEQKFAESGAEYAKKHLKGGEAEQRERRDKRNLELMREWFGDLTDEQEAQLATSSAKLPLLYALRLENRQRRQGEFVALLKAYRSPAELEPRLKHWLTDWEEGASPEYRRLSELHRELYIQMLLELDRGLTPAQRVHAVTRLYEYAEVFKALAEQSKLARSGS
ncbi:MAG: hypothetical protein A3I01_08395 [Betaproteobacteria bacterium RIFCSPLOWO2_02_FULL_65_24]|nr:MAG: hypothetical protein A3I01_08395 [Betaproteobacteria bacterium RIFCSPLOWO2_02_FULL_65_24]